MAHIILFNGIEAQLDETGDWVCEDKTIRSILRIFSIDTDESFTYYPDILFSIVADIDEQFPDEVQVIENSQVPMIEGMVY